MKRIKVTLHKDGVIDAEALEGFTGNTCHTEVEKLVTSICGSVDEKKDKPDYSPDNPDFVSVDGMFK